MSARTAEIGIIGAGPAGAHLAAKLAEGNRAVVLFDPKGAWEKPCGGGLTTRALREFSFLLDQSRYPCRQIKTITLVSPSERTVTLNLKRPFAVYSRAVLNGMLLERATEAGARFIRASVRDFSRESDSWTIDADGERWQVRFLVGADGAASLTRRRLVGIFEAKDLALAFGYNVKVDGDAEAAPNDGGEVRVVFKKDFTGYLWAFPRPGVMNFGVASKLGERTSDDLRLMLVGFIADYFGGRMPDASRMSFFGAKIPTLELASWPSLRATGDGWALVGDAAGFADPITGEGIYYALKSADLLAGSLFRSYLSETGKPEPVFFPAFYRRAAADYEAAWRREFGRELEHAAYRLPQYYHGYLLGHLITDAMVWLARWHRGVRNILVRALMGEQSYVTLKRDLLLRAFQVI